ncbi:ABC-three component system middle component 2 [Adlercreutzia sp. R25]|uniref:ABC-three component system middle component 2 n=1 Tax=Adlercreutzia shanghongiae TaxID=3111773 RepID=UPI002DB72BFD|nr:ABC-three component system middle component 2 [Adlercreutzia sp. R25]MEC4273188.1 ABC-three component system middle component 2 [Adlercreutzia sp. R25]
MSTSKEMDSLNLFSMAYADWNERKTGVFNSPFENMLRILILLEVVSEPLNLDRITALDFLGVYGRRWDVLDKNLHGDNPFDFAEFTHKRIVMKHAIFSAIKKDFISISANTRGIQYEVNDRGKAVIAAIDSKYATEYRAGIEAVHAQIGDYTDGDLLSYINMKAIEMGASIYAELFD